MNVFNENEMKDDGEMMAGGMKSMLKHFGKYIIAFFIVSFLISFGFIAGLVYFVFWCLKHFAVI